MQRLDQEVGRRPIGQVPADPAIRCCTDGGYPLVRSRTSSWFASRIIAVSSRSSSRTAAVGRPRSYATPIFTPSSDSTATASGSAASCAIGAPHTVNGPDLHPERAPDGAVRCALVSAAGQGAPRSRRRQHRHAVARGEPERARGMIAMLVRERDAHQAAEVESRPAPRAG